MSFFRLWLSSPFALDRFFRRNGGMDAGIIKNPRDGVKILGNGELTKKLTVRVNAFSESAKAKIEAAGGTAEVI